MHKIETNNDRRLAAFFGDLSQHHLSVAAVCAGTAPGAIWVNDWVQPTIGFIETPEGAYVNREGGASVAERWGATFVPTDVANHAAVGELIAQTVYDFGRLDCVVSNACLHKYGHVEETTPELWEQVIAVNLSATYHLVHHAALHLRQQPGASIVIISSVQAIQGFKSAAAYATSKGGQLSLMRQLASDLAPQIRVNAILPGTIRSYPESITPEAEKQIGSWHLLGRIGECVEIANGAVFLASDEASFITGHGLVIDGGVSIKGAH